MIVASRLFRGVALLTIPLDFVKLHEIIMRFLMDDSRIWKWNSCSQTTTMILYMLIWSNDRTIQSHCIDNTEWNSVNIIYSVLFWSRKQIQRVHIFLSLSLLISWNLRCVSFTFVALSLLLSFWSMRKRLFSRQIVRYSMEENRYKFLHSYWTETKESEKSKQYDDLYVTSRQYCEIVKYETKKHEANCASV